MFTGLVECVGNVVATSKAGTGLRLRVTAPFANEVVKGESVALDGACLTIAATGGGTFEVDVSGQTLAATTIGSWRPGMKVNVERATRAGGRLGGHLVSGHVDGTGRIARSARREGYVDIEIEPAGDLPGAILLRGSIAVDGISLTVSSVGGDRFSVGLIPETIEVTTLAHKGVGALVNLETDLVGKYVAHYLSAGIAEPARKAEWKVSAMESLFDTPIEEGG